MGKAVQIIKPVNNDDKQTLGLDIEKLDRVLRKADIVDKNVIVLSIAGTFRKGKSFFLSFIVKYLEHLERRAKNSDKKAKEEWLKKEDMVNSEFAWKGGLDPVTSGIYIYNKVFVVKEESGDEVAVVLMDTQGLFDNNSDIELSTTIFALSTMISSMQIFNLSHMLNIADIDKLASFINYANVAMAGQRSLQSLLFLIRDWPNDREFSFGLDGGKKYIDAFLKTNTEENAKKCLEESFKSILGCLLPSPGPNVTNDECEDGSPFKGKLTDVHERFLKAIRLAVPRILEESRVKMVAERRITCGELANYIKSYIENLQTSGSLLPEKHSMYQATVDTFNDTVLERTIRLYLDKMNENVIAGYVQEIEETHTKSKEKAMEFFEKSGYAGTNEDKFELDKAVEAQLKVKYEEFKNFNGNVKKLAICASVAGTVLSAGVGGVALVPGAQSALASAASSDAVAVAASAAITAVKTIITRL